MKVEGEYHTYLAESEGNKDSFVDKDLPILSDAIMEIHEYLKEKALFEEGEFIMICNGDEQGLNLIKDAK